MTSRYILVSGCVFGIVAIVQLVRALNQWPVQVSTFDVPVAFSWLAAAVTGSLCAWAFGSLRK